MRRAISEPIDSSLRRDVVDLTACQADIHQLPVAQVLQGDSQALALALRLERIPTSLEQAQDASRGCGRWSGGVLVQQSAVQRFGGRLKARCQSLVDRVL